MVSTGRTDDKAGLAKLASLARRCVCGSDEERVKIPNIVEQWGRSLRLAPRKEGQGELRPPLSGRSLPTPLVRAHLLPQSWTRVSRRADATLLRMGSDLSERIWLDSRHERLGLPSAAQALICWIDPGVKRTRLLLRPRHGRGR